MRYLKTGQINFGPVFICPVKGTDYLPARHDKRMERAHKQYIRIIVEQVFGNVIIGSIHGKTALDPVNIRQWKRRQYAVHKPEPAFALCTGSAKQILNKKRLSFLAHNGNRIKFFRVEQFPCILLIGQKKSPERSVPDEPKAIG